MTISDTSQIEEIGTGSPKNKQQRQSSRSEGNTVIMILVFIALCLIGGRIIFTTGVMDKLQCQRSEATDVTCIVDFTWWGLISLNQYSVYSVDHAIVEEYCINASNPCDYSVQIVGTAGDTISLYARTKDLAREYTNMVNSFLKENQQEKQLDIGIRVHINDFFGLVFGLSLVVFFGFVMYSLLFKDKMRQRAFQIYRNQG
jgi:hypothetical protein